LELAIRHVTPAARWRWTHPRRETES
jgi:hypothetical protein